MKFLNPRWRKVIRDLWRNKGRTMLVVLSIAVGVFAIGVVSGSQGVLLREMNDSYAAINPESATIMMADTFDDDLVEVIAGMREIEAAQGRRHLKVRFKVKPEEAWRDLELRVLAGYKKIEINKIQPQAGQWPVSDKELLIERKSLAWMEADLGDEVIIQRSDGKERTMHITGSVHDQAGPPANFIGSATGYTTHDTLEWLGQSRDFDRLEIVVAENKLDRAHIETVADLVRNKIENGGLEVRFTVIQPPGEHPVSTILQPLLLLLNGLGGLALVLSGFLVANTISALLARQTRQIGVMKAIGARRGQIMGLYFVAVLAYGLLALLVAVPLGAWGAFAFTNFMADSLNFDLRHFAIPPQVIAMQAVIGLIVPLLAGLYPIISGTGLTVREAISDYGVGRGRFGADLIDRLLQRLRGLSRPLMISLRNTFRRKARLALTLLTLTLAGTTFITIFSVRDSLLLTLDDVLKYWDFDIQARFEKEYRIKKIERAAWQVPGVADVESWGFQAVHRLRPDDTESNNILLIAPQAETKMLQPTLLAGRWLRPDDTNAIVINTDLLQDEPDLEVGDELVLKFGRRETSWQIVGVVQGVLVGAFAYANYPHYAHVARDAGKAGGVQIVTAKEEGMEQLAVAQVLEEQFQRSGLKVASINTIADLRATVEFQFNILTVFLLVMAVVLAIVGGLGLTGAMSINVLERVREIGVMRAIGASDGAVLRLVMVEGMLIGLLSWVGGATIALPVSKLLSDQIGLQLFQSPLSYTFSISGLAIWLVVAVLLAALASFLPARSASRLTVREVLAYE